ncbi:Rid family detoxifying hydrolase [Thermococcus sp.]|uniref:Rid family detoxifying hydrolase n=1 Tax=Thermococcus sp. TaxID=35749 RepID=UPI0026331261|nr:Rid family detoxifying hydrolase [Thermococcus sp.]
MGKSFISTNESPQPIGPYSQGVVGEGQLLFVSGQIPIDPRTGELVQGPIEEAARITIENVLATVKAAGGSSDNVVKVTVYMIDLRDFEKFNNVYEGYFGTSRPARAVVEVSHLPKGAKIEIDAIAVL